LTRRYILQGSEIAFESPILRPKTIAKFLLSKDGVNNVTFPENSDDRLEFEFKGETYIVTEPFGDNSKYLVGPKNADSSLPTIKLVQELFEELKPSYLQIATVAVICVGVLVSVGRLLLKLFK
jgi:hypothetical protein